MSARDINAIQDLISRALNTLDASDLEGDQYDEVWQSLSEAEAILERDRVVNHRLAWA